ncbi:MAG: hypothetical protein RL030_1943 [Pseudomonadota bacterium]|jgi:predicted aspartyl protease
MGMALPAMGAVDSPATQPAIDDELTEVLVVAPEPRYVAPTRRDRIGRVWVPVMINGEGPFRLVLDSGAMRSAVNLDVAQRLRKPTNVSPPVLLRGVTGTAIVPTIEVANLSVGDLSVGPAMLPIISDAFGGAEGLLGMFGMENKRIYIDFHNDFINVSLSRNRRAAAGFETVPFIKDPLQLVVVRARVGASRLPVRAIIDTGAQASIGNEALRFALQRQINRKPQTKDEITGATGDMQSGLGVQITPILLGGIAIRDAHVTFGDMHIFERWNVGEEPALVIGMDILGLLDTFVIDYRRQELHIKALRPS